MLSETFVSIILEASVTGAGLILAIYALITPISRKIFEKRIELLRTKKKEFDKMKKEISSESSKKDLEELKRLALEIQAIRTFPKYLGLGVLMVFLTYFVTVLDCCFWFTAPTNVKSAYEPSILIFFFISTTGFFLVGICAIIDVHQAMKKEYEQLKKEQEEVEKDRKEVEQLIKKSAPAEIMVIYVKGSESDTWHWCKNCTRYPKNIYQKRSDRPSFDLCNQCKSKERDKTCRT